MGLSLEYINGQTPLDEDEKEGLLIPTITTRKELDEFEQNNIEDAMQWVFSRSFKPKAILTQKFIRDLHNRMLGEVWSWAGDYRKTEKTWESIPVRFLLHSKCCAMTLIFGLKTTLSLRRKQR